MSTYTSTRTVEASRWDGSDVDAERIIGWAQTFTPDLQGRFIAGVPERTDGVICYVAALPEIRLYQPRPERFHSDAVYVTGILPHDYLMLEDGKWHGMTPGPFEETFTCVPHAMATA